jgi:flagellar basal body-associated protein FliL
MRRRNAARHFLAALAVAALAGGPALAAGGGKDKAKAEENDEGHGGAKVYGTQYINLDPFTVPFLGPQGPDGQMNLVVALELADADRRAEVMKQVPRIRAAIYESLFASLTTKTRSREIPSDAKLKRVIRKATERVLGPESLTDVLIQQAFENRAVGR